MPRQRQTESGISAKPIISFVKLCVAPWLLLLALTGGCPAPEPGEEKPPGATQDVEPAETRQVLALSEAGAPITVRPFDDPENRYAGLYSELDQWIWDNYDPGEESPANWPQVLPEGTSQRAMLVTSDGFAIPGLEYARFELERRREGLPPGERPADNVLYAIGPLNDSLNLDSLEQRFNLIAGYMPPIPEWLALEPPCWALVLPDGSVVTRGELGSGTGYYPSQADVRDLYRMQAFHYSAGGELLQTGKQGELWCEMFFDSFTEALERHGIGRESVRQTGWFMVFMNLADRSLTGYYLYDGSLLSKDEAIEDPDFSNLFEMYGRFIPEMYATQQAQSRSGQGDA